MPSNVFANTGTNVSVVLFDKSKANDEVVLIDASKMGIEYKEGKNKKVKLEDSEVEKIIETYLNREVIDDFSVVVKYEDVEEKGSSLSAGQYFDVKIQYESITRDQYEAAIKSFESELKESFASCRDLEEKLIAGLGGLNYENV